MSDFKKIKANNVDYGLSDEKTRDNIATIEESAESSRAYEAGEFLIFNGVFYEVIDDISIGDILTIHENIQSAKIADKLTHLENDKMNNDGIIDIEGVEHANNADYATTAGSATTATSADYATSAGTATSATTAGTAGSATTATTAGTAGRLSNTSAIGSSTNPVYFSEDGVPVAATAYANASVLQATQDGSGNTITTYYQQKIIHTTVTIAAESWELDEDTGEYYEATVTVIGVTDSNTVHVSPSPDCLNCGVYANLQSADILVFRCKSQPEETITIYVEIQN